MSSDMEARAEELQSCSSLKLVVVISRSELRVKDLLNEAIVYDESVSVYVMGTVE